MTWRKNTAEKPPVAIWTPLVPRQLGHAGPEALWQADSRVYERHGEGTAQEGVRQPGGPKLAKFSGLLS